VHHDQFVYMLPEISGDEDVFCVFPMDQNGDRVLHKLKKAEWKQYDEDPEILLYTHSIVLTK